MKDKPLRQNSGRSQAELADRYLLYEDSVQCVESELDFVDREFQRLRGRKSHLLREDFCGTANTACEWVRRRKKNHAIAVDLDSSVLDWAHDNNVDNLGKERQRRVNLINDNVLAVETEPQDIILAMNFSYWQFRTRAVLKEYFCKVKDSLIEDGVFFLDCFGGYDAFRVLKEKTEYDHFTYVWEQKNYNPVSGEIICNIHFEFPDGSKIKNAFTYCWRLWTIAEIRELLVEAGFSATNVYWQGWDEKGEEGDGDFHPVESADADAGWIAYLAGVK